MSASTASMPFLSIRRTAALETRRRTKRFSLSTQKRRYCRFGRNRRLVLLLAWETLFPTIGPLPVTSHTRAMKHSSFLVQRPEGPPHLARKGGGNPCGHWEVAEPAIIAIPPQPCCSR